MADWDGLDMQGNRKAIFVTGAGSGLGREVACYFASKGWFIGLSDINEEGLKATACMLPTDQSSFHVLDVADRSQWSRELIRFATHSGGRMDVLFNNAGIGSGGRIHEMADSDIDRIVAVNLTGVINGIRAAFAYLRSTKGSCVLNTCSAAGIYGSAYLSVYSATKFAVRGLTEAHDIEWREFGIKSRSLMPGFIDTGIISKIIPGSNQTGRDRLLAAGIEVSPVSVIGPAAWQAVHGNKVHTYVTTTAKRLAFAARWFPDTLCRRVKPIKEIEFIVNS
jgi:NAD(P)-dependent dehydrogenase (short-subunit alcohol dehydrogenase family)